ncbi:MAG: hypothetical protein ACLFUZ_02215 [Candidatus Micrarchaeia archaeon]
MASVVLYRNTALPFVPKPKFRKKLEKALSLGKDAIESGRPEKLREEAMKRRRISAFLLQSRPGPEQHFLVKGQELWEEAYFFDLAYAVYDEAFLSSISDTDSPEALRSRARECQVTAGHISAVEIPGKTDDAWGDSALRLFSTASSLAAQAEILNEFASIREAKLHKE